VFGLPELPNSQVPAAPEVGATAGQVREPASGDEVEHVAAVDEQRRARSSGRAPATRSRGPGFDLRLPAAGLQRRPHRVRRHSVHADAFLADLLGERAGDGGAPPGKTAESLVAGFAVIGLRVHVLGEAGRRLRLFFELGLRILFGRVLHGVLVHVRRVVRSGRERGETRQV